MPIVSGGGGGSFNGGTITNPLTIVPTPNTEESLVVTSTGGGTTKLLDVTALHTTFTLDGDGTMIYQSDDTPTFTITGTSTSGATFTVQAGAANATLMSFNATGGLGLRLSPTTGGAVGGTATVLLSATDNTGTDVLRLTSFGLLIRNHSAPADGALAAGDCVLWFDQTNGAGNTKLMCKGKSADGTVKTATIATLA